MKTIDLSKPVEVYFNLHKKVFSVRQGGLVVKHTEAIVLEDASFVVSQAGRERVLREKRKNVHALVRGKVGSFNIPYADESHPAYYNPYKTKTFIGSNGEPLHNAKIVFLQVDEKKPKIRYMA